MMDDEIVFLGSSKGPSSAQRPVTGIVLHVEGQESGENYSMTFRKANTSVVHIGRRPGFESSRSQDVDQGNAMFRCAVVSRKHATIAFSDGGHAYLIDLCSHHGTFIRKSGDRFPRKIGTETPTMLADGDIVTFGKSVGKGDECVRPIVARIELLHAGKTVAAPVPIKPLIVPSPSTPPSLAEKSSPPKPASSGGRYGINTSPSLSSDDSYSSQSDIYSDIEEIPPPASSKSTAPPVSQSQSQSGDQTSSGSLGQAFNVLKRLLPPTHTPANPGRLPSVTEIVERPLSRVSSLFFGPPPGRPSSDFTPVSPSFSPLSPFFSIPSMSPPFDDLIDLPLPLSYGAPEDDVQEEPSGERASTSPSNKSRSNSPMDLASPSPPPPEVVVTRSLSIPPLLSPPPLSFPLSPVIPAVVPAPSQQLLAAVPEPEAAHANMDIPLVNSPESSSGSNSSANSPAVAFLESVVGRGTEAATSDPEADPSAAAVSSPVVTPAQLKQIEETLTSLKADVTKLQSQRRKYKARFNSNVQIVSQKLSEFDDRLSEVNAEYLVLANQVENVTQVEVPDLDGQLESLRAKIDDFMYEREEMDKEREDKEKAKEKAMNVDKDVLIKKFEDALDEMKEFTKSMNKQMQEELASVRLVREATQAQLLQMQEEQAKVKTASETPVLTSLKRKRDDIDENGDEAADEAGEQREHEGKPITVQMNGDKTAFYTAAAVDVNTSVDQNNDMAVDGDKVPPASVGVAEVSKADAPGSPPPRKRLRRLASVVGQTATAVTIGAVVTWSALAFS